jgi:hypothetical protein
MRRYRLEMYKAKAEICSRQAALLQNGFQRDRLLKLAEQWSKLADEA